MSGKRTVNIAAINQAGVELHKRIESLPASLEMSLALLGVAVSALRRLGVNDQGIQEGIELFKGMKLTDQRVVQPDAATIAKVLEGLQDRKE